MTHNVSFDNQRNSDSTLFFRAQSVTLVKTRNWGYYEIGKTQQTHTLHIV